MIICQYIYFHVSYHLANITTSIFIINFTWYVLMMKCRCYVAHWLWSCNVMMKQTITEISDVRASTVINYFFLCRMQGHAAWWLLQLQLRCRFDIIIRGVIIARHFDYWRSASFLNIEKIIYYFLLISEVRILKITSSFHLKNMHIDFITCFLKWEYRPFAFRW